MRAVCLGHIPRTGITGSKKTNALKTLTFTAKLLSTRAQPRRFPKWASPKWAVSSLVSHTLRAQRQERVSAPQPLMSGQPHLMVALHSSNSTTTNCPCLSTGHLSLRVSGLCPLLVYLTGDTSPCLLNHPFTQGYKSSLYLLKSFFFSVWFFPLCVSIFALFLPTPHIHKFFICTASSVQLSLGGNVGASELRKIPSLSRF